MNKIRISVIMQMSIISLMVVIWILHQGYGAMMLGTAIGSLLNPSAIISVIIITCFLGSEDNSLNILILLAGSVIAGSVIWFNGAETRAFFGRSGFGWELLGLFTAAWGVAFAANGFHIIVQNNKRRKKVKADSTKNI